MSQDTYRYVVLDLPHVVVEVFCGIGAEFFQVAKVVHVGDIHENALQ